MRTFPGPRQGQIRDVLDTAASDVERRIKIFQDGQLEPMPGRTLDETLEMQIMQVLGKARDRTGEIAGRHLGLENSAVVMAVSGGPGFHAELTQDGRVHRPAVGPVASGNHPGLR